MRCPPIRSGSRRHRRPPAVLAAALVAAAALCTVLVSLRSAAAQCGPPRVPAGFCDEVVWGGLTNPTVVRFAPDGTVFVAEKSGIILRFDGVADPTPTVFADLRTNVHNFWDRGLLGLAIDPEWPARPYVYVLYTYDALPGGVAPRWGAPGATADGCPNPPGATADGCVVTGRLSRLTAAGGVAVGEETVFLQDWCQQYPSHSIGDLAFGADGALYVSGGDGASFGFVDYGQAGGSAGSPTPRNPCGDPPGSVGSTLTPPTAEGGALRSQDVRTTGDAVSLDGAILRIDPDTGAALPDNPLFGGATAGDDRIIAHGLRNPFRIMVRPGTSQVWIGDVGWSTWEEINRIDVPTAGVRNFGWPCYEGSGRQGGYDSANLTLCESLYGAPGAVAAPWFTYSHSAKVVAGEACGTGSSSVSGLAFYPGGAYPAQFDGALFFADYSRRCLWAFLPGAGGEPEVTSRVSFGLDTAAVDLQVGPLGDLYYVDLGGGAVRRIVYAGGNYPPVAAFDADPLSGAAPLLVTFDATASSDANPGDTLTYSWDLDGDGVFGDATGATPTFAYGPGTWIVTLRVMDNDGESDTDSLAVTADNTPPAPEITAPAFGAPWRAGELLLFSGSAPDAQDGAVAAAGLLWELLVHHCALENPADCHVHPLETFPGVASGSFTAPDHEWPSFLELRLTATDSGGLSDTDMVELYPETSVLRLESAPAGLTLALNGAAAPAPWERTVIRGSRNSLGAAPEQTLGGTPYKFGGWSDGGAASHDVSATAAGTTTYVATYVPACGDGVTDPGETCDDGNTAGGDCCAADCTIEPGCDPTCPGDDGFEQNDARLVAASVPVNEDVRAIVCTNDADWYAFPAAAGCAVAVEVRFVNVDGNLNVQLFGPAGNQLAASYRTTDVESVAVTAPTTGTYTVQVYGFQGASNVYTLRVTVSCGPTVEGVCDDGVDDDGDGAVDCADPDCAAAPACVGPPENCDNGVDDDGDGAVDCADAECAAVPACVPRETDCANGLDDDGDGLGDCADLDCAGQSGCAAQCPADDGYEPNDTAASAAPLAASAAIDAVVCANDADWYSFAAAAGCTIAVDVLFVNAQGNLNLQVKNPGGTNIGSGYSTTDDEHAVAVTQQTGQHTIQVYGFQGAQNAYRLLLAVSCPGDVEQACDDGQDNDGDGLADCADGDCAAAPACVVLPEDCDNGVDDDGDGAVDCADADCAAEPACAPTETACANGVDDDGDGFVDCADLDCAGQAGCAPQCPADDGFEPNDTAAAAVPVPLGTWIDAVVCANDADWYSFPATAGCTVAVDLLFPNASGNLNLQVKNPSGTNLGAGYSATDDEHVLATAQQSGTHTIQVYGFQGAQNGYALRVVVTCP